VTSGQASPYGTKSAPSGRTGGGISLQTLLVASVASAVTSFTVSRIWGPGTLFSAAATPVLVALISELVRRPVNQVSSTAQRVAPLRYRPPSTPWRPPAPDDATVRQPLPTDPTAVSPRLPPRPADAGPPRPGGPLPPPAGGPSAAQAALAPPAAQPRVGPRWRLVLVTGLLACAIVVGLFTALDVVAGRSITGNGDSSTYFGGKPAPATGTTTPTTPATGTSGASGVTGTSGSSGSTGTMGKTKVHKKAPATILPPAGPTGTSGATGTTGGATGPSGATGAAGAIDPQASATPSTSPSISP
jgi:hypothetical protein